MGLARISLCAIAAAATMFAVGVLFFFGVPLVAPEIPLQFEKNAALYRPWADGTDIYMRRTPCGSGRCLLPAISCYWPAAA